jgi:hypothetical protein
MTTPESDMPGEDTAMTGVLSFTLLDTALP